MRSRLPWWRLIDWRPAAAVAVVVGFALGLVVARGAMPRAAKPGTGPISWNDPPSEEAAPEPEPPPLTGVGPHLWFTVSASAIDPRIWPGVPVQPVGPFAADMFDRPPDDGPDDPQVFRRMLDNRRNPFVPNPNALPFRVRGRPTFGTRLGWWPTPADAIAASRGSGRLALVVHVDGDSDAGWFAGTEASALRTQVFTRPGIGGLVDDLCEPAVQLVNVRRSTVLPRPGGRIACSFVLADGTVLHTVPGYVSAEVFARELAWAIVLLTEACEMAGPEDAIFVRVIQVAHFDRLKQEYKVTLPVGDAALPPGLSPLARAHAALARQPLPRLERFVPVLWETVLVAE